MLVNIMHMFSKIISLENLFIAWYGFKKGKQKKKDVMVFERNLEDNIFRLYEDITTKNYKHQAYQTFHIWDPKFRIISKAEVRDRVVHHLVFKYLEKIYQPLFIHHSYSCQKNKGVHKAVTDLDKSLRKASKNCTNNVWTLKMDIKKFFASVDLEVLLIQLKRRVNNPDILWLLREIIVSHSTSNQSGRGVSIGNLTSQIFANIYLNELDYYVKFNLKEKYYFRYADDFIFLHNSKEHLEKLKKIICQFVKSNLKLDVHPQKIVLHKYSQGIDFLGYVLLPYHRVLRTKTKKRMFKKVNRKVEDFNQNLIGGFELNQSLQSYFGILKHCDSYGLKTKLKNEVWVRKYY